MSDGTRRKQTIKLNMGSKKGTPQASRAGSPERGQAAPPPARTGTPGKYQYPLIAFPSNKLRL